MDGYVCKHLTWVADVRKTSLYFDTVIWIAYLDWGVHVRCVEE